MSKSIVGKICLVVMGLFLSFTIVSCDDNGGNDDVEVTIRGLVDDLLPSEGLPSEAIPSEVLPSEEIVPVVAFSAIDETEREIELIREFDVELEEKQVVLTPSIGGQITLADTPARAEGFLEFDEDTGALTGSVEVFDLTPGDSVSSVNLKSEFAGANGPVLINLEQDGNNSNLFFIDGELSEDEIDALLDAGTYLSVNTANFPNGLLRGQVVPDPYQVVRVLFQGNQVIGGVALEDSNQAVGYFTFDSENADAPSNIPVANVTTNFNALNVDIIVGGGFAGANGAALQIALEDISPVLNAPVGTVWNADDQPIAALGGLLAGVYYFEAASAQGEIIAETRGQITPRDIQVVRLELEEDQVFLEDTVTGGSGVGFFTFNTANGIGSGPTPAGTGANDGNPAANNPVINVETSFPADTVQVIVGGGFAGSNGAVARIILSNPSNNNTTFTANGPGTPPDELQSIAGLGGLLNGVYYIEALDFSGAEVRGQIAPRGVEISRVELQGQQVVPPVFDSVAPGISSTGFFTFNSNNDNIAVNVQVNGFEPTQVTVNSGFAGINGNEIFELNDVTQLVIDSNGGAFIPLDTFFFRSVGEDPANASVLLRGGYSIVADSVLNPQGELRGQIIFNNNRAFRADLSGAEAIPPVATIASGIGYLTVTDFANELFVSNVRLDSLLDAFVDLNVGGANNVFFISLDQDGQDPNFFTSPEQPVFNLNGLINGAYSFEAFGTEG